MELGYYLDYTVTGSWDLILIHPWRLSLLPGSHVHGSYFRALLMNPARSSVLIVVHGGSRGVRRSGKDIPSIPVSV